MDNITINLTNLKMPSKQINILEVYKSICGQLNAYFVRTGLILIIVFIFFSWFNKWFFNSGYKLIKYDKTTDIGKFIYNFIGDLDNIENRIYWDTWIKHKLSLVLVGYIVVVVYFNWGG